MSSVGNGENKKFYLDYIGCEKRKLDAERVRKFLFANGYSQITDEDDLDVADLVVLVACAFNEETSIRSRNMIEELRSGMNPNARFLLGGCFPDIERDFIMSQQIETTFGTRDLDVLDEAINAIVPMSNIPDQNLSFFDYREYPIPDRSYRSWILNEYIDSKNAFKVRVGWGCLSNCSYCVVKKATKQLKSKSLADIENEIKMGYDQGHRRFFITGDDVGAYGQDIGKTVVSLFRLVTSFPETEIYIQELNAQWLVEYSDEIADILNSNQNNYNRLFINVPIQSGSDKILKKMRRCYLSSEVAAAFSKIRHSNLKVRFGSHFIVGFPGETDHDFNRSMEFVNGVDLDFIMVYTYTEHPDADSARFDGRVSSQISEDRRNKLLELQKELDIKGNRFIKLSDLKWNEVLEVGRRISGWLTDGESQLLFNEARLVKDGKIVEIGSWVGKSTFFLASGSKHGNGVKVLSIDHHTGSIEQREKATTPIATFSEFATNMRNSGVSDIVTVLIMTSNDASNLVDDSISLLFIDGSHQFIDVKDDFNNWWPKVRNGGRVIFHDSISKPDVNKLVLEIINRNDICFITFIDECCVFEKKVMRSEESFLNVQFFNNKLLEQVEYVKMAKTNSSHQQNQRIQSEKICLVYPR